MRTLFAVTIALVAAACAAEEQPRPAAAPNAVQPACKKDSECPHNEQCERGQCLKPNDVGPSTPAEGG